MEERSISDKFKSSRSQMFFKIGVIKNFAYFSWSLFLIMCQGQAFNFVKKRLQNRCFPVKFAKFLKTPFFTEHLRWLLPLVEMQKKYTILNSEGLKRGTKRLNVKNTQILHFAQPFQPVFTCPNSRIKTERHYKNKT